MTAIRITNFGGIIPRVADRLLPDQAAQYALNAKLLSGELRAWWEAELLQAAEVLGDPLATPVDFFPYTHLGVRYFAAFDSETEFAKSPLLNDAFGRIYWTNADGAFISTTARLVADDPPFKLGVPTPSVPTLSVTPGSGAAAFETRVYTVTLVSAYGEEGPNGPVVEASGPADAIWVVNNLDLLTYDTSYENITKFRLYRTITSASGVDYRMVEEFDIADVPTLASYDDDVASTVVAANPVLESFVWTPPPTGMRGLIPLAGGFNAGYKGRTVFFSVPYYPHAWPEEYQLAVEDDIVALGAYGNTLVIATKGQPYVAVGTTPDSMSLQKLDTPLPCLSSRALVSTAASVLYPSPDGLVSVSDQGINIATKTLCTRDDWQTRFTSPTMKATVYADRYMAFYGARLGFVLGFEDPMTAFTELQYDASVVAIHTDRETGDVILLDDDGNLQKWDAVVNSPLIYTWRSKPYMLPKPTNFGALQLRGEFTNDFVVDPVPIPPIFPYAINTTTFNVLLINGPRLPSTGSSFNPSVVSVKVYADGELVYARNIDSEEPRRLPSGFKAHQWEVEVSGAVSLFSVVLASTMKELEQVP